jgi:hypothetical protein
MSSVTTIFQVAVQNDGHLLDSTQTLCGVLYLLRVLEECSASIIRGTKLVLVGAVMTEGRK